MTDEQRRLAAGMFTGIAGCTINVLAMRSAGFRSTSLFLKITDDMDDTDLKTVDIFTIL